MTPTEKKPIMAYHVICMALHFNVSEACFLVKYIKKMQKTNINTLNFLVVDHIRMSHKETLIGFTLLEYCRYSIKLCSDQSTNRPRVFK